MSLSKPISSFHKPSHAALQNKRRTYILARLFLVTFVFVHSGVFAGTVDGYGDNIGTVNFPVSCSEPSQHLMERGVALLHHMTYAGARMVFENVREAEPNCALAYWGVAMTYVHPLWLDPPNEQELKLGLISSSSPKSAVIRPRVSMPTSLR